MTEATLIDGKAMAAELADTIKSEAEELTAKGHQPGLAVVIVGEHPASQVYVRNKQRTAEKCGFRSVKHEVPEAIKEEELLDPDTRQLAVVRRHATQAQTQLAELVAMLDEYVSAKEEEETLGMKPSERTPLDLSRGKYLMDMVVKLTKKAAKQWPNDGAGDE